MTQQALNELNYWSNYYAEHKMDYSVKNNIVARCREEEQGDAYSFIRRQREKDYARYTAK